MRESDTDRTIRIPTPDTPLEDPEVSQGALSDVSGRGSISGHESFMVELYGISDFPP